MKKVIVSRTKLLDYLLSTSHFVGRSKAKFFRGVGFDEQSAVELEKGLVEIANLGDVVERIETSYGIKHIIDGTLKTPSGREVQIRTVCMEEPKGHNLQFVTAYSWRE